MLTYAQVLQLHQAAIREFGGSNGIRDQNLILSAIAQPHQSFGGVDLYPTLIAKAAALGWSLAKNHGFVDGNKRVGWLATKVVLFQLGYHLNCSADEGEAIMLGIVAGEFDIADFALWIESVVVPVAADSTEELLESLLRLGQLLHKIALVVDDYRKESSLNRKRMDFMIISPSLNTKFAQKRLQEAMKLNVDSLTISLSDTVNFIEIEVETIGANSSDALAWLYVDAKKYKEEVLDYLVNVGYAINSVDQAVEGIQAFQSSTKSLQKTSDYPPLKNSLGLLLNTLDDLTFLFNQNWFSFKEMFDIAKKKLDES